MKSQRPAPEPGGHNAPVDMRAAPRSEDVTNTQTRGAGWGSYMKALGPGLITGASDDDPSGIATYSQAGAQFKYAMLWSALLTLPLMAGVQEICDRTALATGETLGALLRRRFGTFGRSVMTVLLVALLVANTANITADLLAIGAGMNLLGAGPVWIWALISGAVITAIVVAGSFESIARVFKYLCLSLFTYVFVLFAAKVEWGKVVANTLIPHVQFSAAYVGLLVAVLGTTLSPYLFFWQTAHRVEEMEEEELGGTKAIPLRERSPQNAKEKKRRSRFDVFSGMTLSNGVMFAIMVATAATLGKQGITKINSAADAAKALEPIVGHMSKILFALGFIGTGFLAVPVLAASASVGLAGLYKKNWGFSESVRRAPLFYAMVGIGTLGGTLLSLTGVNPIRLLVVVAIVNGIAAAPFLIAIMLVSNDRSIMGEHRNGKLANFIGWLTAFIMTVGAITVLATGGL